MIYNNLKKNYDREVRRRLAYVGVSSKFTLKFTKKMCIIPSFKEGHLLLILLLVIQRLLWNVRKSPASIIKQQCRLSLFTIHFSLFINTSATKLPLVIPPQLLSVLSSLDE